MVKETCYGIHGIDNKSSEWDTTLLSAVDMVNCAVCSAFVTIHFYEWVKCIQCCASNATSIYKV